MHLLQLFSATQAHHALQRGSQALLAVCVGAQPAADASSATVPGDEAASSTQDKSQLMRTELKALLHECHDRFM